MATHTRLLSRVLAGALLFFTVVVQSFAVIGAAYQMQLGNPSNATTTTSNHVNYLIQRDQYAMDYNDTRRVPNWVSWDLTSGDVGGSGRSAFATDPDLPAGFTIVGTGDYSGSGYDRGHMCPSADRTVSTADNQIVFYMTNMVPQAPDNNQGVWASFETECRNIASQGNELLITCGPSGFSGSTIASGVSIPGYVWKIVVVVPLNGRDPATDLAPNHIDANTRVIAIKIPNIQGVRSDPWQNYITSVAQIEADTGYTFFGNLPPAVAAALRVKVDGQSTAGLPVIVTQPASQTAGLGGSASFSVTVTSDTAVTYQWSKDDVPLDGETNDTLVLTDITAADVGSYTVTASNAVGSVTSSAAQLIVNGLPPVIATAPNSQTVSAGDNAVFTVAATGSPTLTYQWRKNGTALVNGGNIAGATSATLTVGNAQLADVASYDVVVTNSVSFATSAPAGLFVNAAGPTLTSQPTAQTANLGASVTFTVGAKGSEPLSYQWRKGGTPVSGNATAATASLVLASVTAADAGSYDCVVTNAVGPAVTSNAAALTVNTSSIVTWNFTTAAPSSGLPSDITGGTVTQNNNNGTTTLLTTTSASGSYAGASGGNNAGAAARTGALNLAAGGSAYFEFTLTPAVGKQLAFTGFSFGMRSTSTGPQLYTLYSSVDGFAAPVATGAVPNNGNWAAYTAAIGTLTGALNAPVTFRLYGSNGTGSASANTANWRIDDLKVTVSTTAPAPTAPVVSSTTPADGATGVAQNTAITVNFNQPVSVASGWFSIASTANGAVAATVTGGPSSFTLTPPVSFPAGDSVTVTVFADKVTDLASGTLHPAANYVTSFSTSLPVAPAITTAPVAQTVAAGDTASFTVAASGSSPLTYQWRKNGTAISGNATATSAILTLANVQPGDAGSYDVVVTNSAGSATSSAATLTVTAAAPGAVYWDFTTATPTSGLPADVTGGLVTQNNNNGTTALLTSVSTSSGYSGASGTWNAGAAARTGALNPAAGGSAYFEFTFTPAAGKQLLVTALSFGSRSTSTGPQAYALFSSVDGFAAPLATGTLANNSAWALQSPALSPLTGAANTPVTFRLFGYNGTGSPGTGTANWRIDDLKVTVATLVVPVAPTITGAPAAQTVTVGDTVTFSVAADGTGPLGYQWRKDGSALAGATASTLTLAHVLTDAAGSYDVVVSNSVGSATSAPAVLTVNKAVATVTLGDLAQTYSGAPRVASAATAPAGLAVDVTYNGSAAAPVNAGSYAVVATVNDANYTGTATGTLVVSPAPASVTLGDLSHVYDGTGQAAAVSVAPAGVAVAVTYDGAAALPVNAGSYAVVATIADPNFTGAPATATLQIAPAPAAIALGDLAQTYDGHGRAASVTTTPAGLATSVTYAGNAALPVNAGSYAVAATLANPNYTAVPATGTLVIGKAAAEVALGSLTATYDGAAHAATATTTPTGLTVTLTYDGAAAAPVNAGSYAVAATVDDANYTGSASGTLTIAPATATLALGDLTHVYDGSAKAATVTTTPAGIATTLAYDGSPAAPVHAGSYAVTATLADANYTGAPATGTLTITPATATVTLGNLSQTYDGTPRAATVATAPAGLAVAVTYNGSAAAPTAAGTYAVVATVTDGNYTGSASGTLTVAAATTTVTLSNLTYLYDGTPKSATVTTTPANLATTVTYNGGATAPTLPGVYTVVATVNDANYTGTATGQLVIDIGALVRRLASLNGGIDGAVQVTGGENVTLNGNAWISGDLLVAGTPTVRLNGNPAFGGTTAATGAAAPAGYTVTLNGGSALHRLVTRVDALAFPTLAAVPAPAGTRNVALNNATQSVGDFATLRDLTLNGAIGTLAVPAGTYGAFTVNGNNTLVLGVAGATTPAVYNFQSLTLNGNAKIAVVGPVVINLPGSLTLNGTMGAADHPEWLEVNLRNGSLTLNGAVKFHGFVIAPAGTVTINGGTVLTGGVIADKLVINGNGVLVLAD
ncbi:MBG domain-containing protein [Oleiharenicola sp. Vm1]|uniref:MBG domain-containing protein n=1 Tax=Oleiharenicola sp. Vm1 TaxID=3398393 RepID=UPI0039F4E0C5